MAGYGRFEIPLALVQANPWQTRQTNAEKVATLAADIALNGLLQPPVGRVVNEEGKPVDLAWWATADMLDNLARLVEWLPTARFSVQIAFGHHRLAAFQKLFLDNVPSTRSPWARFPVELRELTDEQMALFGWSENEHRGDLNEIEKATAMQRYITDFGWTQEQVAEKLGVARSTVANKLRVLRLAESDLTRPVFEALRDGRISERQAMPALEFLAQPVEVIEQAESYDYTWRKPSAVIEDIAKGKSNSDEIRRRVDESVNQGLVELNGCTFLGFTFNGDYVSPKCDGCPRRTVKNGPVGQCQNAGCYKRKRTAWEKIQADAAVRKSGLALAQNLAQDEYHSFNYDDYEAILYVYEHKRCENMRIRRGYGAKIPGVGDQYELICAHGAGKRCTCLAAELKRRKREDPAELAKAENIKRVKELREQADAAFAAALLSGNQAAWYALWWNETRYTSEKSIKPESDVDAIMRKFAHRVMDEKLAYCDEKPDQAKEGIDKFFSSLGIHADGSTVSPAEIAWGKFQRVQNWMEGLSREFPTSEAIRGNVANLGKLLVPGLDQQQADEIVAARKQLEKLIPLIESWGADDKFHGVVPSLVSIPPGDGNFGSQLQRATLRVVDYVLAIVPDENNKTRIEALRKRREELIRDSVLTPGKFPEETLVDWMARTGQIQEATEMIPRL